MTEVSTGSVLQEYIHRLQVIPETEIHKVKNGKPSPWYTVTGEIVKDLAIQDVKLREQVQTVPAQIGHWARLTSLAKRIWQIEDRNFRIWKAQQFLKLSTPPTDPDLAKKWKKPTIAEQAAMYRTHPEYALWSDRVERAEEAFNTAEGIKDAFKAQRDMLKGYSYTRGSDGEQELSV